MVKGDEVIGGSRSNMDKKIKKITYKKSGSNIMVGGPIGNITNTWCV